MKEMYCYHKEKRYDSHGNKKKLDKDCDDKCMDEPDTEKPVEPVKRKVKTKKSFIKNIC